MANPVNCPIGDRSKGRKKRGYHRKVGFDALVTETVERDIEVARSEPSRRDRRD